MRQFGGRELEALDVLEREDWQQIARNLRALECALRLLCEATLPALEADEDALVMYGNLEELLERHEADREEVAELDDYERLLYAAGSCTRSARATAWPRTSLRTSEGSQRSCTD